MVGLIFITYPDCGKYYLATWWLVPSAALEMMFSRMQRKRSS